MFQVFDQFPFLDQYKSSFCGLLVYFYSRRYKTVNINYK